MNTFSKLPDTEFEIMKVVWANDPPLSANLIMEKIGASKGWKVQTAITLLLRLVDRGFLRTEKLGKERVYYPVVGRDDYLRFETGNFMNLYHEGSFVSFVSTLYDGKRISETEINELMQWMKARED